MKHYVHLWKLYNHDEVICIKCGLVRKVDWRPDYREYGKA